MARAVTQRLGVIRTPAAAEGHVGVPDLTTARVCVDVHPSVTTEDQKDAQGLT